MEKDRREFRSSGDSQKAAKKKAVQALEILREGIIHSLAMARDGFAPDPGKSLSSRIFRESLHWMIQILFFLFAHKNHLLPFQTGGGRLLYDIFNPIEKPLRKDRYHLWEDLVPILERLNFGLKDPRIFKERGLADFYFGRAISLLRDAANLPGPDPSPSSGLRSSHNTLLDIEEAGRLGMVYQNIVAYFSSAAGQKPATASHGKKRGCPAVPLEGLGDLSWAQRKTWGTYYTPGYIIENMCEKTLGPLVRGENRKGALRNTPLTSQEILEQKVVDPAMGSGLFLLGATDYLARVYGERLYQEGKIPYRPIDPGEVLRLRRIIAERCVFGVDLDPLAVELAKRSLWLFTMDGRLPPSFLHHNFKEGDALFGFLPSAKNTLNPKKGITPWDLRKIMSYRSQIASFETQSLSDFKAKENLSQRLEVALQPLRERAHEEADALYYTDGIEAHVGRMRYFHWTLEFPEVFFDDKGIPLADPGFSVVLGNPPYGDVLPHEAKKALKEFGFPSSGGRSEIYALFILQGMDLLKPKGLLSFIIPNTLLDGRQFSKLRADISKRARVVSVLDFRSTRVFQDAEVYSMVIHLRSGTSPSKEYMADYRCPHQGSTTAPLEKLHIRTGSKAPWRKRDPLVDRLASLDLIERLSPGIAECRDGGLDYKYKSIGWTERGKRPRLGKMLVYAGVKRHPEDKPMVRGRHIERFHIQDSDQYLIHDWKKFRNPSTVVLVYPDLMEVPVKILTRQTSHRLIAALDREQRYTAKSVHTLILQGDTYTPEYLCALLNSRALNRIYMNTTGEAGRVFAQVRVSDLRELPVRKTRPFSEGLSHPLWMEKGTLFREWILDGNRSELLALFEDLIPSTSKKAWKKGYEAPGLIQVLVTEIVNTLEKLESNPYSTSPVYLVLTSVLDALFDNLYGCSEKEF